jgi:hypothetical protein
MMKTDIIRRNPLRMMGYDTDDILFEGQFGALMARAGIGKTAFLVQIALDKMLRDRNVLHISLNEPVDKVCLWYEEVFRNIAADCGLTKLDPLWENILPKRFIMTFKAEGFSVPKLEERITDLTEQDIFMPQALLIDGMSFDDTPRSTFTALKDLAGRFGLPVWFTVRTHRHQSPPDGGMPFQMLNVADLFEVAISLRAETDRIQVLPVKGGPAGGEKNPVVVLEPSTMLIIGDVREETAV